jgi:hypothetical protein
MIILVALIRIVSAATLDGYTITLLAIVSVVVIGCLTLIIAKIVRSYWL